MPRSATIVVLAAAFFVALPAAAQRGDRGGDRAREQRAQPQDRGRGGGNEGLSDSIRRIERSTRSQVLRAERIQSDGRDVNRIKTVDDGGRVRIYTDDPRARSRAREPQRRTRGDDD